MRRAEKLVKYGRKKARKERKYRLRGRTPPVTVHDVMPFVGMGGILVPLFSVFCLADHPQVAKAGFWTGGILLATCALYGSVLAIRNVRQSFKEQPQELPFLLRLRNLPNTLMLVGMGVLMVSFYAMAFVLKSVKPQTLEPFSLPVRVWIAFWGIIAFGPALLQWLSLWPGTRERMQT